MKAVAIYGYNPERQSAWTSNITNDSLTRSGRFSPVSPKPDSPKR